MADRWIKRWEVPKSSGDGVWIVAIDKQGNYGCSCPRWKFHREECHHIHQVKVGGGELKKLPQIGFGQIHQVKQVNGKILIPLVPVGNTHFSASNAYVLYKMGYSRSTVKYYCTAAQSNSMKAIENYILHRGIMIWDKESFYSKHPFSHKVKVVPVEKYYLNQDN